MSSVSSSCNAGMPVSFLIFSLCGFSVKSLTAAAMIAQSLSAKRSSIASRI